jgi:osmotically-inducible protein OsmY
MFSFQTFRVDPTLISAATIVVMGLLSGCTSFSEARKCGLTQCSTDAQVTSAVTESLDRHPEFSSNQLHVATLNHVVYLYGSVANDLQLAVAQSVAAQASGNAKIVNSIAVSEK